MANSDYTTLAAVKRDIDAGGGGITSAHDTLLTDAITEASRQIDRHKRVEDGAYAADDTGDETRYFNGTGTIRQPIDPATSITSVAVEETDGTYTTWTEDTDYFNWPENHDTTGEPIRALVVNRKSDGSKSVWTHGQRRVKVVATFGWYASVPGNVERACKIMVVRWYKRAQGGWDDTTANIDLGEVRFTLEVDPEVRRLLKDALPHIGAGI